MRYTDCSKADTCIASTCEGCCLHDLYKPIKQPFNWELPVCLGLCVVWWVWLGSVILKAFK